MKNATSSGKNKKTSHCNTCKRKYIQKPTCRTMLIFSLRFKTPGLYQRRHLVVAVAAAAPAPAGVLVVGGGGVKQQLLLLFHCACP